MKISGQQSMYDAAKYGTGITRVRFDHEKGFFVTDDIDPRDIYKPDRCDLFAFILHKIVIWVGAAILIAGLVMFLVGCSEPAEPMTRAEQCQIWNKYCDNGTCGGC